VAAVRAPIVGAVVRPSVDVIVGGHAWSDHPVDLAWYRLPSGDPESVAALAETRSPDAVGPAPELAYDGPFGLGLVATSPDGGEVSWIDVDVATPAVRIPAADGIAFGVLEGLTADGITADELPIDVRREFQPRSAAFVEPGGVARIKVQFFDPPDETPTARWMASAGSFLELDKVTTDWVAGEFAVDDGEPVPGKALDEGVVTVMALVLGGGGDNRVAVRDVFVGEPPAGGLTATERFLPSTTALEPGFWRVTLTADDDAPSGLSAENPVAVDVAALPGPDPYGTRHLPCTAPVDGPFDPTWLLEQRCLRRQVVDHDVVIAVIPW
jgi:hypothetical protein